MFTSPAVWLEVTQQIWSKLQLVLAVLAVLHGASPTSTIGGVLTFRFRLEPRRHRSKPPSSEPEVEDT